MKVIEKKSYDDWKHIFECEKCESKLEADHTDLRATQHSGDQRDQTPSYWSYHVVCEVCNERHTVPGTKIPKYLASQAQERSQRRNTNYMDR